MTIGAGATDRDPARAATPFEEFLVAHVQDPVKILQKHFAETEDITKGSCCVVSASRVVASITQSITGEGWLAFVSGVWSASARLPYR
jgi:hypothetical protein